MPSGGCVLKSFAAGFAGLSFFLSAVCGQAASPCDLNGDGTVNPLDVQLASAMASGLMPCSATVAGVGVCNATVVQRVTLASSGGVCLVGDDHGASLAWTASASPGVVGYYVYRGPAFSGPFTRLNALPVTATAYNDDGLSSGQAYYYATTAVDQNNNESAYSNIAQANTPHSVVLSWSPSISANVVGYHIYRGATPAGPYNRLTASPVAAAGYTDYRPAPGQMYYYAATAVDVYGNESEYSLTAQAVLPLQ